MPIEEDGEQVSIEKLDPFTGSIQLETSADQVLQVWNQYKHAKNEWGAVEKRIKGQMTAWLATNGPLYISATQSIKAGKVKKRVCVDRFTAFRAVSDAIAELPENLHAKAIEAVLPAQPFRYGEVLKLVGDDVFQTIYSTETTDVLKIDELDTKWIKRSKGAVLEDASRTQGNDKRTERFFAEGSPDSGSEG